MPKIDNLQTFSHQWMSRTLLLWDCHPQNLLAVCEGQVFDFRDMGRNDDSQRAFFMNAFFRCRFNFSFSVNDRHIRFSTQKPGRFQHLVIIYQQCRGQDLHSEELAFNRIFTTLAFKKHRPQLFHRVCWRHFNGEHLTLQGFDSHFLCKNGHSATRNESENVGS